jgi:hypothetical protein
MLGRKQTLSPELGRWLPEPTPETQHFWDGTKAGILLLQRCDSCDDTYFPPQPFCAKCASRDVSLVEAGGRAKLMSYVISHRRTPGFEPPFSIAIVELEEGPRMLTNIIGCAQTPEALVLDMALEVVFEAVSDDITLPLFRPMVRPAGDAT